MATNSQGLTPEQMSNLASTQMEDRVNAAAMSAPGTIVVGGQTGETGYDGLTKTPTTYQAMTQVNPIVPLVQPNDNQNVLSSDTANSWAQNVAHSTDTLSSSREADGTTGSVISGMPDNTVDTSTPQWNSQIAMQGATDRAKKELSSEAESLASSERSADLSAKAAGVQTGVAGTDYGNSVLASIARQHAIEQEAFKQKEQNLISQLLSGSASGAISATINKQQQLQQLYKDRQAATDKALQDQLTAANLDSKLAENVKNAQANASDDLNSLLKSGVVPNQNALDYIGKKWGISQTDMALLAGAANADNMKQNAKDDQERYSAALDAQTKLSTYLDSRPLGEPVQIGDYTYYGTGKGRIKTGVEVDKTTGEGRYYEFNPDTGATTMYSMGSVGFADPGWTTVQTPDGLFWRIANNEGENPTVVPLMTTKGSPSAVPMQPGDVQRTNATYFKDGKTGPALPGHEANAGQCGAACNYWYGTGILGDSYDSKLKALTPYVVGDVNQIQSHDTFLMKVGTTGHVGTVGDIFQDPKTGKLMFTCTESNYVPPNQGLLSNTRVMAVDDPRITMFARVPTPNLPPAGSDSRATTLTSSAVSGQLGAQNQKTTLVTPSDIKAFQDIAPGAKILATDTMDQARNKVTAYQLAHPEEAASALTDSQLKSYMQIAPGAGVLATDTLKEAQSKVAAWQLQNPTQAAAPDYQLTVDSQTNTPYGYDSKTNTLTPASFSGSSTSAPKAGVPGQLGFGAKPSDEEKPLTAAELTAFHLDPSDPANANLTRSQVQQRLQDLRDQNGGQLPLTGDEENAAELLASYKANINDVMKGRTAGEAERLNRRAKEINPDYSPINYEQRQQTINDFSTAGTSGQAVQAATKVLDHLADLKMSADTVNMNRGFFFQPRITRDLNQNFPFYSALGDVSAELTHTAGDLHAYNTNRDAVAEEMNKVFSATGGSLAQVQGWKENVNDTNTATENHKIIQKMIDLLGGQLKGMYTNYVRVMNEEPAPFLNQQQVDFWKNNGFDTSQLDRYTLSPVPNGQVRVIDKASGQKGVINKSEFDPNVYYQY